MGGTTGTRSLAAYLRSFREPGGYLNFASYGPPSTVVVQAIARLAERASFGHPSGDLHAEDERAVAAVARVSGFSSSAVALTTSTSLGLLQVAFGLPRGEVLVSEAEFPANLYAWWRSEEAGLTRVRALPPLADDPLAPVTPERIAAAVGPDTVAVAISAVDSAPAPGPTSPASGRRSGTGCSSSTASRGSASSTSTGPRPTFSSQAVRSGCGRDGARDSSRCRLGRSIASVPSSAAGPGSRMPAGTTAARTARSREHGVSR